MPRKSNGRRGNFQLLMVNDPDGDLSPGTSMAIYIRIGGRNAYAPSLVPEKLRDYARLRILFRKI